MKKEMSAWDRKMAALMLRSRWVMTGLVALQISDLVHHYKVHDVTGWPVPSAWVLPWLTFGCVGTCFLVVMVWIAYLYKLRRDG